VHLASCVGERENVYIGPCCVCIEICHGSNSYLKSFCLLLFHIFFCMWSRGKFLVWQWKENHRSSQAILKKLCITLDVWCMYKESGTATRDWFTSLASLGGWINTLLNKSRVMSFLLRTPHKNLPNYLLLSAILAWLKPRKLDLTWLGLGRLATLLSCPFVVWSIACNTESTHSADVRMGFCAAITLAQSLNLSIDISLLLKKWPPSRNNS